MLTEFGRRSPGTRIAGTEMDGIAGDGNGTLYRMIKSAQIRARDEADSTRAIAPLRPAEDAVILDSTSLDMDAVVQHVLELVESCRSPAIDTP